MHRLALLLAALMMACGSQGDAAVSTACTEGPQAVAAALRGAPGDVALGDGTTISACVEAATSDAELQEVGAALTQAAEELEARAASDPRAALELGYLIGAARRGAPSDAAIQAELIHRLERSGALDGPTGEARRELARGLEAGEAHG
jgi:hypothetical protein